MAPGERLQRWLDEEGHSQTWLAERLKVSAKHVSFIVRGRTRYSADLAVQLGRVTGIPAREWMHMQADWDLVQALQAAKQRRTAASLTEKTLLQKASDTSDQETS